MGRRTERIGSLAGHWVWSALALTLALMLAACGSDSETGSLDSSPDGSASSATASASIAPDDVAADFASAVSSAVPSDVSVEVQYAIVAMDDIDSAGSLTKAQVSPGIALYFKGSTPKSFNEFEVIHGVMQSEDQTLLDAGFKAVGVMSLKDANGQGWEYAARIEDWDVIPGGQASDVLTLLLTKQLTWDNA